MDRKKLIRDFPPSPVEEVKNWQGPPNEEDSKKINTAKDMWTSIAKRDADRKMREDAIDQRMQKSAVNAGQYGAMKRERADKMQKLEQMRDARDSKVVADYFDKLNKTTSVSKSEAVASSEHEKTQNMRGHGKAIKKRLNDWKVK